MCGGATRQCSLGYPDREVEVLGPRISCMTVSDVKVSTTARVERVDINKKANLILTNHPDNVEYSLLLSPLLNPALSPKWQDHSDHDQK